MVSRDKLAAWIGGTYNLTGTPTAADVGANYCSVVVAPTLPTCVTEGTLVMDSTRAFMCIYTRFGFVPVALTAGGLFSRRFTHSHSAAVLWHNTRYCSLGLSTTDATTMSSTYYNTNKTEIDHGFGTQWWGGGNVGYKPSGGPGHRIHASLWPTNEMPWKGATVAGSLTQTQKPTSGFGPLIGFGGWHPVYATVVSGSSFCASNQTNDANEGPISIGGVNFDLLYSPGSSMNIARASTFGFKAASNYAYPYAYEHLNKGTVLYVSDKTAWWF